MMLKHYRKELSNRKLGPRHQVTYFFLIHSPLSLEHVQWYLKMVHSNQRYFYRNTKRISLRQYIESFYNFLIIVKHYEIRFLIVRVKLNIYHLPNALTNSVLKNNHRKTEVKVILDIFWYSWMYFFLRQWYVYILSILELYPCHCI